EANRAAIVSLLFFPRIASGAIHICPLRGPASSGRATPIAIWSPVIAIRCQLIINCPRSS
ncbi:MAG TPA: hypothetical protein VHO90_04095, partial [Bacteroidales bacterium]|nr:hypothetical protein [Bacteroidales bacterium]